MVRPHLFLALITLTFTLFNSVLHAATLETHVDKKELIINEHITLTIALINSDTRLRAQGVDPNIDLTVLTKDFELGIPRASNRYSPFRNRGRSSSEIVVTLFPKASGQFTIPAFTVDGESSQPLSINVHQISAASAPEVFTQNGILKSALWLREQTIVYLDLYHRVELKSAKLGGALESKPKLQIQLSQLPQSDRTEEHNGISYNVTRTSWAVAPAINKTIQLYLPDVWVETSAGEQLRFPFKDITIDTIPLPEHVPPLTFIGKPKLSQSIVDNAIPQHQSFQLQITLQATTNVINLPPTPPALQFPEGLKVYSESGPREIIEGSNNGSTTITYRYFIMPLIAGEYRLPDLTVPYFDPERSELSHVTLRGQSFSVTPATIPVTQAPLITEITSPTSFDNETADSALPWKLATLLVLLAWLVTALIGWRQRQNNQPTHQKKIQPTPANEDTTHPLQLPLLAAFSTRTLDQGLQQWERQHGVDNEMRTTIHQIQRYCYGQQKNKINSVQLQQKIDDLVQTIKQKPTINNQQDNWRPEAFTAKQ